MTSSHSEMENKIDVMRIDVGGPIHALEDAELTNRYYLDLETGEMIRISELFPALGDEKLMRAIEAGVEKRYLEAPRMLSQEAYGDMADFIETLRDENLKEKIYIAIDGPGAFRRFKNVLLHYPEEREHWFKFKENRLRERAVEWLIEEEMMEECGIEITEVSREDILSIGVNGGWKEISPTACLECECTDSFEIRHFIVSRLPEGEGEEKKLRNHMWARFGVKRFDISPCALKDGRSILDAGRCLKCGSQEISFDL